MFSKASFTRQTRVIVLGITLVSLFFISATTSIPMRAIISYKSSSILIVPNNIGAEGSHKVGNLRSKDSFFDKTYALRPEEWKTWDIIPSMSPNALSIYKNGLEMGNNPRAFSKVGDGEISTAWFLTDFDLGPNYYDLGGYTDLQTTVNYFAGSFSRQGQTARRGFNVQRVLDPSLTNSEFCQMNETPLDCEIRIHRPSFAMISMGTNQVWQAEQFESGMRAIIEKLIACGVVPVLSTKADNLEGDHRINLIIARLAAEYDIPLWNFWRAVQSLPNSGLQKDHEHLTYFPNDFGSPEAMKHAWPVRNLTALQTLDALMKDAQK